MANLTTIDAQFVVNNGATIPRSGSYARKNGSDQVRILYQNAVITLNYKTDTIEGNSFSTQQEFLDEILSLFTNGGGSGDGAVESVTGNLVDNTDPANPTVNLPIGTNREVPIYVDGEVNSGRLGWSQLSDMPSFPPFANGVLAATAMNSVNQSQFWAILELGIGAGGASVLKPGVIPYYNSGTVGSGGATLPVENGINSKDAVNKGQLDTKLDTPTGTAGATVFACGDGTWKAPVNTTYSVMAEAEATAGTVATARAVSAQSQKRDILNRTKKYDSVLEVSTSITLAKVHADRNKPIVCTGGNPLTFTVPPVATGLWEVGDAIPISNFHGAFLTFVAGAGVNINSADDFLAVVPKGWAELRYVTANSWHLIGSLSTGE